GNSVNFKFDLTFRMTDSSAQRSRMNRSTEAKEITASPFRSTRATCSASGCPPCGTRASFCDASRMAYTSTSTDLRAFDTEQSASEARQEVLHDPYPIFDTSGSIGPDTNRSLELGVIE